MTPPLALRIAARELRGGLRGFRVFLLCLALGVAAIAAVGSVREAIRSGLERDGALLLGGDAEMSFSYRYATETERAWMRDRAQAVSEVVDFRSMLVARPDTAAESALTQVKGVDARWPLYGAPVLEPAIPLAQALAGRDGLPGALIAPALADRLGLGPGDRVRLGTQDFVITALLLSEPDDAGDGFGYGPRTLVRTEDLAGSSLLGPGTLFETKYRLALPPGADLATHEAEAQALFRGTGLRWRDARNGAPGIRQFVDRLGAFLLLVGLAGLAVGGVGVAAAVRSYLDTKTHAIATLKTLGAEHRTILAAYGAQIAALAGLGIAAGVALGALLPLLFAPLITARLPVPAVFQPYPGALAEAALYGALTAAIFTLWPLAQTERVRAAGLFRDAGGPGGGRPRLLWLAIIGALAAALIGTAALLSGAAALTLWAGAGVLGALGLLMLTAVGLRALARRLARARALRGRIVWRLALASLGGPGGEMRAVLLALGLGLSVLAAVGQIDTNLRSAIARDLPEVAPSFFVVDIQPGQIDAYRARIETDPGVSRVESAPMLRGILTRINGRPAREVAGDHWVLNGDRGVTYSDAPPASTRVTAGQWWPADWQGPAQVSFAAEEAGELGLRLGDEITVNILGRDITATITSFREVDFSTAGIGFILSMNPAALAGAPHSHISTIYASAAAEPAIARDLGRMFPNVTTIRVRDALERVADILGGIASAITWGAMVTLVTGAVVLIGTAATGARARVRESAILKTLGATRGQILASLALRSALLGLAAGAVALLAGALAGWAVMRFVMEVDYALALGPGLAVILGGIGVVTLAGLGFAWGPLGVRPARVLRARD